jgi:hypothetical protein
MPVVITYWLVKSVTHFGKNCLNGDLEKYESQSFFFHKKSLMVLNPGLCNDKWASNHQSYCTAVSYPAYNKQAQL